MPRTDDSPAYAPNWRTVLLVDAALGVVGIVIGLYVLVAVQVVAGSALAAAGLVYLGLVIRRYRRWQALRAESGY